MENVLAPLHAWTHSTPSAASTARNLANLRHNFKAQAKWSGVENCGVETDIPFGGWGDLETFQSWSSIVDVGKMNASPKSPEQKR
ncbi:hypothetical protein ROHU_034903 [Labeo rohita]|uniref:Uncharacterized protein n=1 Tax=Labeo rohita TaxID=84645 RepID=A0A498L526_LABRO|nr:hypothetical protein ROHU_034903 [Labeo rohita]